MRLLDILTEKNCIGELTGRDKEEILRGLCLLLEKNGTVRDAETIHTAVMERERLGSTGVGDGVAIPHAKTGAVEEMVAAFCVVKGGVDFDSVDDTQVKLICLLLAPEKATGAHLKALARVSRILKDADFCEKLSRMTDSESIFSAIAERDAALG